MEAGLPRIADSLMDTLIDVLPIIVVLFGFQALVLRERLPNLRRTVIGLIYVVIGLALFLVGLEQSLFPIGKIMAEQLGSFAFVHGHPDDGLSIILWHDYFWLYLFAATIGFSTTIAEPSLMAVAMKAREVSGGAVGATGLRVAVAIGVGLSVAIGAFRIVTGTPLYLFMIAGYVLVVIQTIYAPRVIVPLAYDSGGVATSTVTVPLVAALGLGLASTVPGRSALVDGFGMIGLACLFPMITVMTYAQLSAWWARRAPVGGGSGKEEDEV